MKLVRTGGRTRLAISRQEWERIGAEAGWAAPKVKPPPEGELVCTVCGQLVGKHDLREHLELHNPNARGMDLDDVRDCYHRRVSASVSKRRAGSDAASVEVRP